MNYVASAILAIPYATALILLGAELLGVRAAKLPALPRVHPNVWIVAILATYALQLGDYRYAALHGTDIPQWRLMLPLPIVYLGSANLDWSAALLLVCGAAQSCALLALFRHPPCVAALRVGCAVLLGMSLAAPALTSADLYSNVGYALLGGQAYAPPAAHFTGEYSAINQWWGTPMVPAPYGPVWLAIDRLVTGAAPTLLGKLFALRCLCAVLFLCAGSLVFALGLPWRYRVVFFMNPGLAMQFVSNAHNDVVAIVAILSAAVLLRRKRPWPAMAFLVAAGAIKLPYMVLALPVLAGLKPVWQRCAVALLVVVAGGAISWYFGGRAYFDALLTHTGPMSSAAGWHTGALVVATLLVAFAFFGMRRLQSAVWLLPPIGGFYPIFVYPWYLAWGIPYALNRHRNLAYLLVLFPFVAALVDQLFVRLWTIVFVFPITLATALALSAVPSRPAFARDR